MKKPVLAYWDIRGLAQPIRLLLAYTGTEYEEKLYKCGPAPDYDKSCWFDVKFKLGLNFPNLPYYIDGDLNICQSSAILGHIARKNNMSGESEKEKVRVEVLHHQIVDFRNTFVRFCYSPDFEKTKPKYLENLPSDLKQFSDFLGDNKWFAGNSITYVDFMMYEMLDQHKVLKSDCLKDFKNLQELTQRFENLEAIKKYINSPQFIKSPLNNKMAKFGNK